MQKGTLLYPRTGKARARKEEPQEEQEADRALSDLQSARQVLRLHLGLGGARAGADGVLRENFPFVANLDESQILFVDCRATGDPASDKSLRDHLGTYPPNMKHTTTNPKWVDWWKEVRYLQDPKI